MDEDMRGRHWSVKAVTLSISKQFGTPSWLQLVVCFDSHVSVAVLNVSISVHVQLAGLVEECTIAQCHLSLGHSLAHLCGTHVEAICVIVRV